MSVCAPTMRFIPVLRHVDEPEDGDDKQAYLPEEQPLVEYRDEASRPWWRFFDEYEYRLNKYETSRHKWWYWFDEGTSRQEKVLICKLDVLIAFYVFIVYWVKSLDQSNISNAYVSNMKEDLNFKGNDFINALTCYNVAAVVFQLPAMYLFPRIPLHLFFPIIDICWGLFTLFSYKTTSVGQIQAMRFFVGAFEASFYPAVHYILGSWYLPGELARRGALFYFGQMVGTISSGLLQGAVFKNLDGTNGIAGWRWMFIVDAIITLPIGILGFFMVPGTPYQCYSIWLTDDEIRLARSRLKKANITPPPATPPNFFDKKLWKNIIIDWKVYLLTLFSICCWNNSSTAGSGYILWLKSLGKYSIEEVNNLSCIAPGIGFALIAIVCGGADIFRCRYGAIAFSQVLNFISNIILLIWDVPDSAKWFAFCILYAGWSQASVMYTVSLQIFFLI